MSPFAMIGASVTIDDGHLRGGEFHCPTCCDTGCCVSSALNPGRIASTCTSSIKVIQAAA
jgi:hypothetical protein